MSWTSLRAALCALVLAATPLATQSVTPAPKSAKRGIAYQLADPRDFAALSPGVSWWYNWTAKPMLPPNRVAQYGMD